jgi:hypothetical protein
MDDLDGLGDKNLEQISCCKTEGSTASGHSEPHCVNLTFNPYILLASFDILIMKGGYLP